MLSFHALTENPGEDGNLGNNRHPQGLLLDVVHLDTGYFTLCDERIPRQYFLPSRLRPPASLHTALVSIYIL